MSLSEIQLIDGFSFRRYPESKNAADRRYYKGHAIVGGKHWYGYAHRYVWETRRGPIPPKHHIHHKDGNTANNSISNLECVAPGQHAARHPLSEEQKQRRLENLDAARGNAKIWHSSPEGREFHRMIAPRARKSFISQERECDQCAKSFMTKKPDHSDRFCSNACKSAWRRAQGVDDANFVCKECGITFRRNRYAKPDFCSVACRGYARAKK